MPTDPWFGSGWCGCCQAPCEPPGGATGDYCCCLWEWTGTEWGLVGIGQFDEDGNVIGFPLLACPCMAEEEECVEPDFELEERFAGFRTWTFLSESDCPGGCTGDCILEFVDAGSGLCTACVVESDCEFLSTPDPGDSCECFWDCINPVDCGPEQPGAVFPRPCAVFTGLHTPCPACP